MSKFATAALLVMGAYAAETENQTENTLSAEAKAKRELVYHTNSVGIKTPDWPYFGMPFAHPWAPWGGFYGAHPMHYGMGMYGGFHPGMYGYGFHHPGMYGFGFPGMYGYGFHHPGMYGHFFGQENEANKDAAAPKTMAQVDSEEPIEEDE